MALRNKSQNCLASGGVGTRGSLDQNPPVSACGVVDTKPTIRLSGYYLAKLLSIQMPIFHVQRLGEGSGVVTSILWPPRPLGWSIFKVVGFHKQILREVCAGNEVRTRDDLTLAAKDPLSRTEGRSATNWDGWQRSRSRCFTTYPYDSQGLISGCCMGMVSMRMRVRRGKNFHVATTLFRYIGWKTLSTGMTFWKPGPARAKV